MFGYVRQTGPLSCILCSQPPRLQPASLSLHTSSRHAFLAATAPPTVIEPVGPVFSYMRQTGPSLVHLVFQAPKASTRLSPEHTSPRHGFLQLQAPCTDIEPVGSDFRLRAPASPLVGTLLQPV